MIREGNRNDAYTKFKSAGKLAKTVAHWKTKGIDVAVSRFVLIKLIFLKNFLDFRQILRENSTMLGSRTKEKW